MAKNVSFETLNSLIQELTKDKPSQARVRKLMEENGLSYTDDSITQMTSVLGLMSHFPVNNPVETKKRKQKEKAPEL